MHTGNPLLVLQFRSDKNPLNCLPDSLQSKYIKAYLEGACVQSIVIEQNYFDRDYLDEFSAFYSKSARGYTNICKRLHFFKEAVTSRRITSALNGSRKSAKKLQNCYLGFVVIRPLSVAPFGRTVLSWYDNKDPRSERVTPLLRTYTCNLLGLQLQVDGIPWQQQDRGVSACATIALWSMFHSSAFDANHSVPTTVEITRNAHKGSSGVREFPSIGLSIFQIREAIFSQRLAPKIFTATKSLKDLVGFEGNYLASMCAASVRSGYPVLLVGEYVHVRAVQQHAICCIGFREKEQAPRNPGSCSTMDDETEVFYVHDDNIGPNVRCRLVEENGLAVLVSEPPDYVDRSTSQPSEQFKFRPNLMIIAVHDEIRMDAEALVLRGNQLAADVSAILNRAYQNAGEVLPAISYNAQFLDVRRFFTSYLSNVFERSSSLLGKVRRSIGKDAPPLSLHVGLVSVGICENVNKSINVDDEPIARIVDVIYDTTDSALSQPPIAHVVYDPVFKGLLGSFPQEEVKKHFGIQIIGYEE